MRTWAELPALEAAAAQPLPAEDPAIDALSPEDRAILARIWAERAESELGAGAVFSAVSRGLFAEGAGREVLWLAARAVCDELRHAEICRHVAARYGGRTPDLAAPPAVPDPPGSAALYAVINCAVNETIGSAFLTACHDEARGALARAALRELLTDEVDHARIGWALLGSDRLAEGTRREAMRALPELVGVARAAWVRRAAELPEELPPGHGCLCRGDVLAVVDHALSHLVLPGFEHVGIDPRRYDHRARTRGGSAHE